MPRISFVGYNHPPGELLVLISTINLPFIVAYFDDVFSLRHSFSGRIIFLSMVVVSPVFCFSVLVWFVPCLFSVKSSLFCISVIAPLSKLVCPIKVWLFSFTASNFAFIRVLFHFKIFSHLLWLFIGVSYGFSVARSMAVCCSHMFL